MHITNFYIWYFKWNTGEILFQPFSKLVHRVMHSSFQEFTTYMIRKRLSIKSLESSIKKCSPNTPTDLCFKNWRRKHTRWTEPRRDRSAHAKLASASGPTHHPPTSTSGRCQVTDEASSYASLQRRRRNPDKGAKEATRRQSSLLAPRSRFSRCKDHSECQITARQRRQRLFLHFPFDEGKGTVADKLVTTPLSLSKLGYIFFTLVENEENSVTGIAKCDKILFFLHSEVNSNM